MPAPAARELYVYYGVAPESRVAVVAAVQALQAALRLEVPGMVARLLVAEDKSTLMETYARPGLGVDAALQDEIERRTTAFAPLLDSPRHVEVFVALT